MSQKPLLRKIPLVFTLTLLANIAAGLIVGGWTASAYNSRIDNLEKRMGGYDSLPADIADIKATLNAFQRDTEFLKNYILRQP